MAGGVRLGIGAAGAALVVAPVWVGLAGLGMAAVPAAIVATVVCGAGAWLLARALPGWLDDRGVVAASPLVLALIAATVIGGAAMLIRIAPFMADPARADASIVRDGFYDQHNCLTAYVRAGELVRRGAPNVYAVEEYMGDRDDDPRAQIGPFGVDPYEYPPPFLVPVRAVLAATDDFAVIRALWFSFDALLVAGALAALAWWIASGADPSERRDGLAVAALLPVLLACVPVVATLQMGNFQLATYAMTLLALILFERARPAIGGALLGAAIVGKLFPGLFLVALVARRRWRDVGWTVAWCVALTVLALAVVGTGPFHAFVSYQLPRMADGRAFPWLEGYKPAIDANHSIFGLVYKLKLVGVAGMTPSVAGIVAWIYTLGIVAYTFTSARHARDRLGEAVWWLVVLQLAVLRSPFAPDVYALVIPTWLCALLAIHASRAVRIVYAVLWLGLAVAILELGVLQPLDDDVRFALTGLAQAAGFAILALAIRRVR